MTSQIVALPLSQVRPDPQQPRKIFEAAALADLWASIRENGLQQPIAVRRDDDGYCIVFGERRYRAHLFGGAETIDAMIVDMDDRRQVDVAQLIENDQRQAVTPLERGRSYAATMERHGWSVEELAKRIGKRVCDVLCWTDLLKAEPEYQDLLATRNLTPGQVLEMAKLSPRGQKALFDAIRRGQCPTGKALKAVAAGLAEVEAQPAMFAMPAAPSVEDKRCADRLSDKISRVCDILSSSFDDNEIVAARRINPANALATAERLVLIQKHLNQIEMALRSSAVQADLLAAA